MSLIQDEPATDERHWSPLPARPVLPEPNRQALVQAAGLRALREFALVVVLFAVYKVGRVVAAGHVREALANADDVWRFERLLHLPSEYRLQQAVIGREWLIEAANGYYA